MQVCMSCFGFGHTCKQPFEFPRPCPCPCTETGLVARVSAVHSTSMEDPEGGDAMPIQVRQPRPRRCAKHGQYDTVWSFPTTRAFAIEIQIIRARIVPIYAFTSSISFSLPISGFSLSVSSSLPVQPTLPFLSSSPDPSSLCFCRDATFWRPLEHLEGHQLNCSCAVRATVAQLNSSARHLAPTVPVSGLAPCGARAHSPSPLERPPEASQPGLIRGSAAPTRSTATV
ncbi:hypothetical protein GGI43DRAFT_59136 [Trichoderma evansii]